MAISYFKYFQLAYFSAPACERTIYRHIAKNKPSSILEIGLGLGVRALRMLDIAARHRQAGEIRYTGIDLFEARTQASAALCLKDAYKLLKRKGARIKLVPGDALAAMTVTANEASNTDLIVIDSDIRNSDLQLAWRYFPRMMHSQTLVLRQRLGDRGKYFERINRQQIEDLAGGRDPGDGDQRQAA